MSTKRTHTRVYDLLARYYMYNHVVCAIGIASARPRLYSYTVPGTGPRHMACSIRGSGSEAVRESTRPMFEEFASPPISEFKVHDYLLSLFFFRLVCSLPSVAELVPKFLCTVWWAEISQLCRGTALEKGAGLLRQVSHCIQLFNCMYFLRVPLVGSLIMQLLCMGLIGKGANIVCTLKGISATIVNHRAMLSVSHV